MFDERSRESAGAGIRNHAVEARDAGWKGVSDIPCLGRLGRIWSGRSDAATVAARYALAGAGGASPPSGRSTPGIELPGAPETARGRPSIARRGFLASLRMVSATPSLRPLMRPMAKRRGRVRSSGPWPVRMRLRPSSKLRSRRRWFASIVQRPRSRVSSRSGVAASGGAARTPWPRRSLRAELVSGGSSVAVDVGFQGRQTVGAAKIPAAAAPSPAGVDAVVIRGPSQLGGSHTRYALVEAAGDAGRTAGRIGIPVAVDDVAGVVADEGAGALDAVDGADGVAGPPPPRRSSRSGRRFRSRPTRRRRRSCC